MRRSEAMSAAAVRIGQKCQGRFSQVLALSSAVIRQRQNTRSHVTSPHKWSDHLHWRAGKDISTVMGSQPRHHPASNAAGKESYDFDQLYFNNFQELPTLPIPNLDDTLDRYLKSLRYNPLPRPSLQIRQSHSSHAG